MSNRRLSYKDEGAKSPGGMSWGGQAADVATFFKDIRKNMANFDNKELPSLEELSKLPQTPIFYNFVATEALKEMDKASRNTFMNALLYAPGIIEKRCNAIAVNSGFFHSGTMPTNPKMLLQKCPFMKYVDMDKVIDVYPQLVAESAKEGFITDKVWYDTGLVDIFEAARQKYNEIDKKERPMANPSDKWEKPQSREHRTLIQRDFEHLSHPKRVAERKKILW